ncbi:hypothetical protein DFO52_1176 [Enterobacter sp. AG326]|nr:hypothetical protein DFO52_1176 [Enterobacter sp. AG326]
MSAGDALKIFFRQTGHGHHGIAVNATLQHRAGNFQGRFTLTFGAAFLDAALFARLFSFSDFLALNTYFSHGNYMHGCFIM